MPEHVVPQVSVIIRVKDKVELLGGAIASVRAQTVAAEIVVVDSGSTDGSAELADREADRVVRIPAESFTFGGALNRGAELASAPLHVALSSHCGLPHRDWLARVVSIMADERVGAAGGKQFTATGHELSHPVNLDAATLDEWPLWSLSNHASAWRADVWRECPFDEELVASEDLLFARHVTRRGWLVVLDPALFVPSTHRTSGGVGSLFRRVRREVAATAVALDLPAFGPREALGWWFRVNGRSPLRRVVARLDPRRLVGLVGVVAGFKDAGRLAAVPIGRARQ